MVNSQDDSLAFKLTWFDEMAASDRPFKLLYYPVDNSIEIVDLKTGKLHLRRIVNHQINREVLFVGNRIQIYGRTYLIKEFGDV
jgi:nucleoside-diphosphate kinase